MSVAAWLSARELRVRWGRAALAATVVASLAAAAVAMESIGRVREEALADQADAIGPSFTVVRAGVTPGALARHEVAGRFLPSDIEARVVEALGSDVRRLDRRLTILKDMGGKRVLVIGSDDPSLPTPVRDGAALVGAELARTLGTPASVTLGDTPVHLAGARPSTGSAEDLALTVSLETARSLEGLPGALTELRLYLRTGASSADVERRLAEAHVAASIVRHDRGSVVESEIPGTLARHRLLAYAVMALAGAVSLLIISHLDSVDREGEVATLLAIGAPRAVLLAVPALRSVALAAAGATAGATAGVVLAILQDPIHAGALARHWTVPVLAIGIAIVLAAIAALPSGLRSSLRDPSQPIADA